MDGEEWSVRQRQLAIYYDQWYPFAEVEKWLSLDERRELSITMKRRDDNEIYRRFISCENLTKEFKELLLTSKPVPHKFDIGSVYNKPARLLKDPLQTANTVFPVEHELIFDIDINDYDDLRECCQGKQICQKCWQFIVIACKVLHVTLQEQFDVHHVYFVFSGRRGIHVWCQDASKRYSGQLRQAIVNYVSNYKYSQIQAARSKEGRNTGLTPCFAVNAVQTAKPFYKALLQSQPKLLLRDAVRQELVKQFPVANDELQLVKDSYHMYQLLNRREGRQFEVDAFVYSIVQPRLDANVTKDKRHLLKAPFCIHQGTSKLCCPVDIRTIAEFDPNSVLTLGDIVADAERARGRFEEYLQVWQNVATTKKAS